MCVTVQAGTDKLRTGNLEIAHVSILYTSTTTSCTVECNTKPKKTGACLATTGTHLPARANLLRTRRLLTQHRQARSRMFVLLLTLFTVNLFRTGGLTLSSSSNAALTVNVAEVRPQVCGQLDLVGNRDRGVLMRDSFCVLSVRVVKEECLRGLLTSRRRVVLRRRRRALALGTGVEEVLVAIGAWICQSWSHEVYAMVLTVLWDCGRAGHAVEARMSDARKLGRDLREDLAGRLDTGSCVVE
ncbi:uncharacterized protein EKO05_0001816 [Ascochyta rabiei]|uniref:uncharacterized protein n=1 Tax=Didymella rabiei TaxID=5454 RepID=UPI0021F9E089|nr:uncharacterized protein EKO05_0001816 [Ascochyta rabiei]UPX11196.1 hypothetical protein EKO05_0001816 [Ascochyta rabiei]